MGKLSVAELQKHGIKIPTEMSQNLMILHSYILVKVSICEHLFTSACPYIVTSTCNWGPGCSGVSMAFIFNPPVSCEERVPLEGGQNAGEGGQQHQQVSQP